MSVSQPFVLILIDYLMGKKVDKKMLLDKIPFFALAGVFVVSSYLAARDAMNYYPLYSGIQRIFAPAYEIVFYLVKSVAPVGLCAFYYLPDNPDSSMTMKMVVSAIVVCGLAAAVYCSRRFSKKTVFGSLFFCITLVPVLQIVVSSGAWTIIAERYTYVPMIGIYFVFASICDYLLKVKFGKSVVAKYALSAGLIAVLLVFSVLTFRRCSVWKDNFSLWNDVIAKSPSAIAYNNRGIAYNAGGNYDRAIQDFNRAIMLDPKFEKPYNNRADAYNHKGDYNRAILDYNQAIALNPKYAEAFYNRGIAYNAQNNFDYAIEDFSRAIKLNPHYAQSYNNRAVAYCCKGDYNQAIDDLNGAIRLDATYAKAWYNRGNAFNAKGDHAHAQDDFKEACDLGYEPACGLINR